jgi:hypothetical protein
LASQQLTVRTREPKPFRDPRVSTWLPFNCYLCGNQLALLIESHVCCVICGGCSVEWRTPREIGELLHKWPTLANWLIEAVPGPEKYNRGREDNLLFAKGLGANQTGRDRSQQLRYCIDIAHDWPWDPKQPNGQLERDELYGLKARVGVDERASVKSILEMLSKKIRQVETTRHIKITESRVDNIAKLARKGIEEAERLKPTTRKDRTIAAEVILQKEGYWPP